MAAGKASSGQLPPGFRFHPTDEELIMHYLRNQATSRPLPVSIIPEVDIYKFDPWELPGKSEFGANERYFFSPRDRKYPNGVRPNRATVSGYWKATGTDKAIYSEAKYVGVKKALVFYQGRPPKGVKTDWIMHEYRLTESRGHTRKQNGSMRLDDWVLCRIYKKKHLAKAMEKKEEPSASVNMGVNVVNEQQMMMKIPRTCSLTNLLEMDFGPITQLLGDSSFNTPILDFQNNMGNGGNGLHEKPYTGQMHTQYAPDSEKLQVNPSSSNYQPILYVNQVYDLFGFER